MGLQDAQRKAQQVLDDERKTPTLNYISPAPFVNRAAAMAAPISQRGWRPRPVSERPGYFTLASRNYNLLETFLDEVPQEDRPLYLGTLEQRILEQSSFYITSLDVLRAGQTAGIRSELPLVAEFLVRHGEAKRLLAALPGAPLRPGLTRLLQQLEDMIAIDYRLFSDEEYNQLSRFLVAAKSKMSDLGRQPRLADTTESNYRFHVYKEGPVFCETIIDQCDKAKYLRLAAGTALAESGRLQGVDALEPNSDEENFDVLARQVRSAIEEGSPELGLDRLHTFALKYIRTVYQRHFGRVANRNVTANSLLGEIANDLRTTGVIKSKMATEIFKSTARVLEEFNHVRNNQTFAHDNRDIITRDEAYFIYQSVAASIRFLKTFEKKI
jgi:hypothetical protein